MMRVRPTDRQRTAQEVLAMTTTNGDRHSDLWPLTRLRAHPKQSQLFPEPPLHEIQELAADMRRNGLIYPVEVLPDGTLIAGHKRTAAARLLGWTAIAVWVRDVLADDVVAAEKRLIEDNLNRRQMGPLGLARCYRHLKELEKAWGGRLPDSEHRELRDRIGMRLGVSGRTLDRYLRVLDTPQEIQDAVAADRLPVTVAERVAGLPNTTQAQIATEIREGGDVGKIVRRFLAAPSSRIRNANDVKDVLVRALERAAKDLNGRVGEIRWVTDRDEAAFQKMISLIREIRAQGRRLRRRQPPEDPLLADFRAQLGRLGRKNQE